MNSVKIIIFMDQLRQEVRKMNFEELIEIDRHPFSSDWEEIFYRSIALSFHLDTFSMLAILLQQRFLEKFNQNYNMNLNVLSNDSIKVLFGNLKEIETCEEVMELMMEYEESCMDLFIDMACYGDFEVMHIDMYYDEWEIPRYGRKKYIKRKLRKYKPSWKPLIWKNIELIEDARYMDNPEVYILRNREIYIYHTFCQKFEKFVDMYLKKEREALDSVIEDMAYPLFFQSGHSYGYISGFYYICFDTGYNGYECFDMKSLNLTWVLSCFVFHKLLEDFKIKVRQAMDIEMELGKVR